MVRRSASAIGVTAVALAWLAPAAVAKEEGVRARLVAPLALDAAPGETVTVAWRLRAPGGRRFDAGGIFVRLRGAAGARSAKVLGRDIAGRYVALVRVPRGGIRGIDIGLHGIRYLGAGPGRGRGFDADVYFPLDNDPFAGRAPRRARAAPAAATRGGVAAGWLAALGALAAGAAVLGTRAARRRSA